MNGSDSGWFAPATVAQILVAGATLFLAVFTFSSVRAASRSANETAKLAKAADREVAAAHRQNELAEKTLLASIQPVLSDFPRGRRTELDTHDAINRAKTTGRNNLVSDPPQSHGYLPSDWVPWASPTDERKARLLDLHIWSDSLVQQAPEGITGWGATTLFKNVGNGAAIVEGVALDLDGKSAAYQKRISKLPVARDDYCRVTFNVLTDDFPDPLKGGGFGLNHAEPDFFIEISYSNVSGSGRLRSRQRIQIIRGNPHIAAIEIWDQESGERLAVSEYLA